MDDGAHGGRLIPSEPTAVFVEPSSTDTQRHVHILVRCTMNAMRTSPRSVAGYKSEFGFVNTPEEMSYIWGRGEANFSPCLIKHYAVNI
jgi:hypothetical protein